KALPTGCGRGGEQDLVSPRRSARAARGEPARRHDHDRQPGRLPRRGRAVVEAARVPLQRWRRPRPGLARYRRPPRAPGEANVAELLDARLPLVLPEELSLSSITVDGNGR